MTTLHLKKDITKIMRKVYLEKRGDNLLLIRVKDGSFIVVFEKVLGTGDPSLLLGCIGQWMNTDDLDWAEDIFNALMQTDDVKLLKEVNSVGDCMLWLNRLNKWLTQPITRLA